MGSEIQKPKLWNPDKWLPFGQKPFDIQTDFEWTSFQMVRTKAIAKAQPFEIRPSKSPDFE